MIIIMYLLISSCASNKDKYYDLDNFKPNKLSKHKIKFMEANGLKFAYIEKGKGPLVLLIHGFPDNASTYDNIIDKLAKKGYRAVAYFTRGYYPTDIPKDNNYSVKTLAKDALAIVNKLGEDKFYLIGHDWGASTAYNIANQTPERVRKLVTIAIPHPKTLNIDLKALNKARHFVLFQVKGYSEWYTKKNNFKYIDYLYDYWSPNWSMPEEQRENIKKSFSIDGRLTAAINYYRSLASDRNNKEKINLSNKVTEVPTLIFAGDSDGAIDIKAFNNMDSAFSKGHKLVKIRKGGHFVHNQREDIFLEEVLQFFKN